MKISIIGSGYVGLVTAVCLAEFGHSVICLDKSIQKIRSLRKGRVPFYEKGLGPLIQKNLKNNNLVFTTSYKSACKNSIIFICVDTPSDSNGLPDLTNIKNVVSSLKTHLASDCLIVTKSTVPIGFNEKLKELFKSTYSKIRLCSNPEFLQEGTAIKNFMEPDRVVLGCDDPESRKILHQIYAPLVNSKDLIIDMSVKSAELTKYASNSFLATKISFVNEISRIADSVGANMHEVRLGMGSDSRIGNQFLFSGLGYGGSCFPKDLDALIYTKKMHQIESGLIEKTVQVNNSQVQYFLKKIFKKYRGVLHEKSIAIWGVAFKSGTDDLRSSISLEIINSMSTEAKSIHLFDVLASKKAIMERTQDLENIFIHNDKYVAAKKADILIIANDDYEFKNTDLSKLKHLTIFDGRNILDRGNVENHGIDYFGLGT